MKLKLYGILGVIVIAVGIFVSQYLNNHSFVSDEFIKEKNKLIQNQKKQIATKDSLLFSCQQNFDISQQQLKEQQIVLLELQKQLKQAKNDAKQANDAIAHYEENGLIRYFQKPFLSRCYVEVFEKPNNICK